MPKWDLCPKGRRGLVRTEESEISGSSQHKEEAGSNACALHHYKSISYIYKRDISEKVYLPVPERLANKPVCVRKTAPQASLCHKDWPRQSHLASCLVAPWSHHPLARNPPVRDHTIVWVVQLWLCPGNQRMYKKCLVHSASRKGFKWGSDQVEHLPFFYLH